MYGIESHEGFVGYFSDGDWVAYPFNIPEAGNYTIELLVATERDNSSLIFEPFGGGSSYGVLNVPNTNGWTNWQRISQQVTLQQGYQHIAIVSPGSDVNLKQISIKQ